MLTPVTLPYQPKLSSKKYNLTCVVFGCTKTSARLEAAAGLPRKLLLFQGRGLVRQSRRDVTANLFLALFSAYTYYILSSLFLFPNQFSVRPTSFLQFVGPPLPIPY
jgi:hypothetical protein